ncbi:hypothetical protein KP509_19G046100 [Ceratopteris richardii]|uniref:Uncharacterized protein n=1 Tax=Ceratopteris richardii TaxID=49495 RepID=A0A8T2SJX0_CERRI|nr:hypothetical protein KP509_19G046100 [Ceratopteris richardii]
MNFSFIIVNESSALLFTLDPGVPWTEDEHRMFLVGLQKLGKGDWRGIAWNFVPSRTPTQVASHAQKYFLRQNNLNKRKRRSSLFDMTTSSVSAPHGTPENVASMVVGSHVGKPLSTTILANFCLEVHKGEPIVHEGQHVSPQSQCMHEEQQMPTRMQCHNSPAGLYATAVIDEKNLLPLTLRSSVTSNPNTDIVSSSMPLPSPPSSFSQVPLLCRKDENADFSGNLTLSIGPPSMIEPQAELSLRLEQPNSTRHAALGDNSSTLVANAIKVV